MITNILKKASLRRIPEVFDRFCYFLSLSSPILLISPFLSIICIPEVLQFTVRLLEGKSIVGLLC